MPLPRLPDLRALFGDLPRPFWFIFGGTFVNRCGSFVLPFMAIYLTEARHLSYSKAGLVIALYGAGGTIAGPLGGYLADHVGRRATMLMALGLGGAGMVALGFATRLQLIVPALFLIAIVSEMYRPAMQAALADLVPPAGRVRAFGLVYWAINLGWGVGLSLAGVLAGFSFRWLFVGDGLTTLLFALLVWRGVPETKPAHATPLPGHTRSSAGWSGFFAPYRDLTLVLFLVLSFLFAIVFMQNATTFTIDMAAHGIAKAKLGLILALNGILIVAIQPFLAPFLTSRDRSRTLAVGSVLVGIGFGLNAIVHTASLYALGVLVWTVGEIGVLPVANTVVADLAPAELRGRYQGAYGLAFGSAVCVGPIVGTLVLQKLGSAALWSGCFVVCIAVAIGHLALGRSLARVRLERLASV